MICPKCGTKIVAPPGRSLGIAALVLGICAVVFSTVCTCSTCLSSLPLVAGLICGVMGIILGAVGMSESRAAGLPNSRALAGLILSILALVLLVLTVCLYLMLMLTTLAVDLAAYSVMPPYVSPYSGIY